MTLREKSLSDIFDHWASSWKGGTCLCNFRNHSSQVMSAGQESPDPKHESYLKRLPLEQLLDLLESCKVMHNMWTRSPHYAMIHYSLQGKCHTVLRFILDLFFITLDNVNSYVHHRILDLHFTLLLIHFSMLILPFLSGCFKYTSLRYGLLNTTSQSWKEKEVWTLFEVGHF